MRIFLHFAIGLGLRMRSVCIGAIDCHEPILLAMGIDLGLKLWAMKLDCGRLGGVAHLIEQACGVH